LHLIQTFPLEALGEQVAIGGGFEIDYKLELNCAGPKHVFFMDSDGSLTGMAKWQVGQE
jgi:hypothetical protein